MVNIKQKIVGYSVVTDDPSLDVQQMHERVERPDVLTGATYAPARRRTATLRR